MQIVSEMEDHTKQLLQEQQIDSLRSSLMQQAGPGPTHADQESIEVALSIQKLMVTSESSDVQRCYSNDKTTSTYSSSSAAAGTATSTRLLPLYSTLRSSSCSTSPAHLLALLDPVVEETPVQLPKVLALKPRGSNWTPGRRWSKPIEPKLSPSQVLILSPSSPQDLLSVRSRCAPPVPCPPDSFSGSICPPSCAHLPLAPPLPCPESSNAMLSGRPSTMQAWRMSRMPPSSRSANHRALHCISCARRARPIPSRCLPQPQRAPAALACGAPLALTLTCATDRKSAPLSTPTACTAPSSTRATVVMTSMTTCCTRCSCPRSSRNRRRDARALCEDGAAPTLCWTSDPLSMVLHTCRLGIITRQGAIWSMGPPHGMGLARLVWARGVRTQMASAGAIHTR